MSAFMKGHPRAWFSSRMRAGARVCQAPRKEHVPLLIQVHSAMGCLMGSAKASLVLSNMLFAFAASKPSLRCSSLTSSGCMHLDT